jgi:hypothetical protein
MSTKAKGEFKFELHLPNGGWLDYWTKNATTIKQFIATNKLQPIVVSTAMPSGSALATKAKSSKAAKPAHLLDLGIRGGMMAAHLHFGDDVYLLNAEQWGAFSTKVLKASRAALASAKTVSFDAAMTLQSALQTVAAK